MWVCIIMRRCEQPLMRYRFPSLAMIPSARPADTARPRIRASVSRDVPVYCQSVCLVLISPTHRRMARAELTWVPGVAPRWFTHPKTVTHPGTNRARRRVTMLIELPLSQTDITYSHFSISRLGHVILSAVGRVTKVTSDVQVRGFI